MKKPSASAKKCQATSSKSRPVKKPHVKKQTKLAGKKLKPIQQDSACLDKALTLLKKPKMRPHDIMEFYSCPRLVPVATQKFGLRGDVSLDLVHGWDALKADHRKIAEQLLWHLEPGFLMTSPPCTFFSPLMPMWNFPRMSRAENARRKKEAHQMVDQSVDSCLEQHRWGRLFCFERPIRASSWKTTKLAKYMETEGTYLVCFDQCSVGLLSPMGEPMMKRTRLWANCEETMPLLCSAPQNPRKPIGDSAVQTCPKVSTRDGEVFGCRCCRRFAQGEPFRQLNSFSKEQMVFLARSCSQQNLILLLLGHLPICVGDVKFPGI